MMIRQDGRMVDESVCRAFGDTKEARDLGGSCRVRQITPSFDDHGTVGSSAVRGAARTVCPG